MKAYILNDNKDGGLLWLAFGEDPVDAAQGLVDQLNDGNTDIERFSVCGSAPVTKQTPINLGKLWPFFTATPPERFTL